MLVSSRLMPDEGKEESPIEGNIGQCIADGGLYRRHVYCILQWYLLTDLQRGVRLNE
jgi:hypothetical protein